MSRKSKGINAERDLIHKFWGIPGWAAVRVAGSGSMRYPSADVIATNRIRKLAIECKTSREPSRYIEKEEVKQLQEFASYFNAEPWLGVKFDKSEWLFLAVPDIQPTDSAFVITQERAQQKGLLFEELIRS